MINICGVDEVLEKYGPSLSHYPFLLGPSIAALAMSSSSALVAINALMLKRTKLTGISRRPAATPPVALTTKIEIS